MADLMKGDLVSPNFHVLLHTYCVGKSVSTFCGNPFSGVTRILANLHRALLIISLQTAVSDQTLPCWIFNVLPPTNGDETTKKPEAGWDVPSLIKNVSKVYVSK